MFQRLFQLFSRWYERSYRFHVALAAFLFTWQLVHLYWLTTNVVFFRVFGVDFFPTSIFWQYFLVVVDYTEIPALILTSLVYFREFEQGKRLRSLLYLFLLNSQWLHLFWITDEFVVHGLLEGGSGTVLPLWLAWIAIGIDYLELPVIYDTLKKAFTKVTVRI